MTYGELYDRVCDIGAEINALNEGITPNIIAGQDDLYQLSRIILRLENKLLIETVREGNE